jgi:two-component system, chemotaxis family, protein-glutamate methylesterase/glutaminase
VTLQAIVMVGVSAGGLQALSIVLKGLPAAFAHPIVIVQHRSKESTVLCELLADSSPLPVSEVTDKMPIEGGRVYVAPADYHLLVEPDHFSLSCDAPAFFSRPSIDWCFETAAYSFGERAVGIVMTGANADGSRGLRRIVDRGGRAIVQDPATAEVPVMPAAAREAVPEAAVLRLEEIPGYLAKLPGAGAVPGSRGAA